LTFQKDRDKIINVELINLLEICVECIGGKSNIFCRKLLNNLKEKLHFDSGSILILKGRKLKIVYGIEEVKRYINKEISLGKSISGLAALKNKILILINGIKKYKEFKNLEEKKGIKKSYVIPLRYKDKVVGVLNLNYKKDIELNLSKKDLSTISGIVGIMVKTQELVDKISNQNIKFSRFIKEYENSISIFHHELINSLIPVKEILKTYYSKNMIDTDLFFIISNKLNTILDLSESIFSLEILKKKDIFSLHLPINIDLFIKKLIFEYSPILKYNGKRIFYKENQDIIGFTDEEKLSISIRNVINNSLRYAKGLIKIETEKENGFVKIVIEDDGPGIEKEIIERILKEKSFPSSKVGFGLFITKNLIEKINGKFEIESSPSGTKVTFKIPQYKEKVFSKKHILYEMKIAKKYREMFYYGIFENFNEEIEKYFVENLTHYVLDKKSFILRSKVPYPQKVLEEIGKFSKILYRYPEEKDLILELIK
jgi:anti-sigma regulatory factor (Ser/Thr protein kinase)